MTEAASPKPDGLSRLVAATMATLLAADLFNLYVWLELMLIATLGLLALGGKPATTKRLSSTSH